MKKSDATAVGEPGKTMKILAVGNSFSEDATTYINGIASAAGVNLTVVNLYIGGCSLETHWNNAKDNAKAYSYQPNGVSNGRTVTIKEVLESDDWDFISMQQVSDQSGKPESYYPYIENLAKYIKSIEPKAELVIHQTWAYETGYERIPIYGSQDRMFEALKGSYDEAASRVGRSMTDTGIGVSEGMKPLRIIPCGQAMQNARALSIFDDTKEGTIKLCRDGYHASLSHGRYLLGAVWYEALTGRSISANAFKPADMTVEPWEALKRCAYDAVVSHGWGTAR